MAQQKKFFLGGSLGGSTSKTETEGTGGSFKQSIFNVSPEFGFYIKENVALGIRLSYGNTTQKFANGNKNTYPTYSVAPFVRINVPLWSSRFSVYNDLGISAGYAESFPDLPNVQYNGYKTTEVGIFYRPGLQFRLKDNINLLGTFGDLLSIQHTQQKRRQAQLPALPWETTNTTGLYLANGYSFNTFNIGINLLF